MVQLHRKNPYIPEENRINESDEYNQPIHLNEVKITLSLLHKNKSEDPRTIKNEFLKGETIAILLKDYFQQILISGDIPTQWNSSTLINIDKGHQDKEKLDNNQ